MKIAVLMYHKVGAQINGSPDHFLNVSKRDFERQMRLLKKWGYTAITYEAACLGLYQNGPLPQKPVCITFDDGYVNVDQNAVPILKELDWPATIFVPTGFVGSENLWDVEFDNPMHPIMGWDRLKELQSDGWEIAGHTHQHVNLSKLSREESIAEIMSGRQEIGERLGKFPLTFCYPFGGYNESTPELVKEAGFIAACTTKSGLCTDLTDPLQMPRVKIAFRDGIAGFVYRFKIRPML